MRFGLSTRNDPFAVALSLVIVGLVLALLVLEGAPTVVKTGVITVRTVPTANGYSVVLYSTFPGEVDVYLLSGGKTLGHAVVPSGKVIIVGMGNLPTSIVFYYSGKRLIEGFHEGTYFLEFRG